MQHAAALAPLAPRSFRYFGLAAVALFFATSTVSAAPTFTTFEATGPSAAAITAVRDAFRAAVGGGTTAGADGSFGGVRREVNWDGVPDAATDPNPLPANFFNSSSPRGIELSTPGTGFMVSANAGGVTPTLFGFANDFQAFSPQKLFTAVNSNITDVRFFVPGSTTVATTTAFAVIFTDVEVAGDTKLDFYDENNALIYSHDALVSGNQGLSFLGATVTGGEIARVRITSGLNTIVSNGVLGSPNDDVVVMDDFIYAEPSAIVAVPEPASAGLLAAAIMLMSGFRRMRA